MTNGKVERDQTAAYVLSANSPVNSRSFSGCSNSCSDAQPWQLSNRFDARALPLADRHYNRRKIGSPQFVPPGRCIVLLTKQENALWVTSWPFAEYVKHSWAGAWVNSCFRNEAPAEYLSSELIRKAVAATCALWPEIPALGMITFINTEKVRRKRDWGRCYRKAGFRPAGTTVGGLIALKLEPSDMPEPLPAFSTQGLLAFSEACSS